MLEDFEVCARTAQDNLYSLAETDDPRKRAERLALGQAWAVLAAAHAIHELAESRQERDLTDGRRA